MTSRRAPRTIAVGIALALMLAGCAAPTVAAVSTTTTDAATAAPAAVAASTAATGSTPSSTRAPSIAEWCASYASLTSVLARSSSDAASAATALAALERFDLLWGIADNLGIVAPDEVAANQRAVASYRAVMTLVAAGDATTSPAVVRAVTALTAQTNSDRTPLRDSASRVLGLCGGPSPSATG